MADTYYNTVSEGVPVSDLEKVQSKLNQGEQSPASSSSANSVLGYNNEREKVGGEKGPEKVSDGSPRPIGGFKWVLVVCSILSGLFLFALDNTVVADIQPAIVTRFNSIDKIAWLATGFLLPATSTILAFGQFYGIFNAKWLYIFSVVLFEIGSAICGAAPDMDSEIAGRVIAGFGATGIYVGVLFLLSVNTTMRERPFYIGLTGAMWGLGTVLGPVVGGGFAESKGTWRWAFYINLIIGAVTAPVLLFLLPQFDPQPGVPYSKRLKGIDYLGDILIIGSLTSLVLALTFGGNTYAWNSGQVIGCWIAFGVLLILFAISQSKYMPAYFRAHRVFPVDMLFNRTTVLCFILTTTASAALFLIIYYLPLFFQFTRGDSPLKSAVRLLPLICTLVFAVVVGGGTMAKVGYYSPYFIIGSALSLIGSSLMYTVKADTSTSAVYGYSVLVGIGTGLYCQAGFSVAQTKVDASEAGQALGFISLGQLIGGVIPLSIAGTVFINRGVSNLRALLPDTPPSTLQAALAGTSGAFIASLDGDQKMAVLDQIVSAMSKVYILGITAAAIGFAGSLFLKHERVFMSPAGA